MTFLPCSKRNEDDLVFGRIGQQKGLLEATTLRKRAYSNILKILQPKKEIFR